MKLLVVCQYYYPEPFRIHDICETLVKKGHEVTVLTGVPNYPEGVVPEEYRHGKKRDEVINGVRVIRNKQIARGSGAVRRFLNYFSFAKLAKSTAKKLGGDFDAVFVNQLSPVMMAEPACAWAKKYKKPMMLYCLDLWPASLAAGGIGENSPIHKLFRGISRKLYAKADRVLVTSAMFGDYFKNYLGLDIDVGYMPQYAEGLFETKADPVSSSYKHNLVFAGNVGEMQSVDTIIKAASLLCDMPDVGFHIVGDGSALASLRQLHEKIGGNVVFHGRKPVEDMPSYYAMADAMLVTMKSDPVINLTLPGKVQSYMAAGKPIIGAVAGESALVIERSGCGMCCPPDDAQKLAQTIRSFFSADDHSEMASKSKKYYDRHFSKERFFETLENELCALINK